MNSIDAAIAQASQAAANVPAQAAQNTGTAVAPASQQSTAVAQPGQAMGLNDAMAGVQIVDEWLKVNEHGLSIGSNKPLLEEILVEIDMSEVAFTETIKFGNPATYEKTYDRVLAASGKTWADAVHQAQRVDPKARPYKSADLTFTTVNEVELKGKTLEAGTTLGHSLSTTGFKSFARFVKALQKAGIDPTKDTVRFTLGYEEQASNGNTWGILDFRNPVKVG